MTRKIIPAGRRKGDVTFKLGDPLPSSRKKSTSRKRRASAAPKSAPMPTRASREKPASGVNIRSVHVGTMNAPISRDMKPVVGKTSAGVYRKRVDNSRTRPSGDLDNKVRDMVGIPRVSGRGSGPTSRSAPKSPRGNNPRRIRRSMEMMRKRMNRSTRTR